MNQPESGMSLPPLDVPGLLRAYNLRPDKRLGQNFLMDNAVLQRIVSLSNVAPVDTVLEIGPGLGSLTRFLVPAARRVVAVELDADLVTVLRDTLGQTPNLEIVQGDILKTDPARLNLEPGYLVVANIPYYITSAILRHLLEQLILPSRMTLTVQYEVAQRICAEPGDMSLLALSVQVFGKPKVVGRIPAGAFYPAPNVDSAVVRVEIYPEPFIPRGRLDQFFLLIKAGFCQKRKTLRNTLSAGLRISPAEAAALLEGCAIDPRRRAETLSLDEWRLLTEAL